MKFLVLLVDLSGVMREWLVDTLTVHRVTMPRSGVVYHWNGTEKDAIGRPIFREVGH